MTIFHKFRALSVDMWVCNKCLELWESGRAVIEDVDQECFGVERPGDYLDDIFNVW